MGAGELSVGEEVSTADGGRSRLVAKERRGAGPEYVYNLEVWRDHNFHVGAQGVLVHNHCVAVAERFILCDELTAFFQLTPQQRLARLKEIWKQLLQKPDYFKRGRFFEAIAALTKFKNYYWLNNVSVNFEIIDFALNPKINNKAWEFVDDKIPQTIIADEVVSFKTTTYTDWTQYLKALDGKMEKHLNDFNDKLGIGPNKGFTGKQKTIRSNNGKVVIAVPEKNFAVLKDFPKMYKKLIIEVITDNDLID